MTPFATLEKPMAFVALACAVVCLLWKSPIGIDWVPAIGPAWLAMFEAKEDGSLAQYPRRDDDEEFWRNVYFVIYGLLATAAQWGSLQITLRRISKHTVVMYSKLYGVFHLVIGIHHLVWSQRRDYGKLEMWRYDFPGVYQVTSACVLWMIYRAALLIFSTKETTPLRDICHRKAVMDTVSVATIFSCFVFTGYNLLSIPTSFETERVLWAITMYSLPLILIAGEATA